MPVHRLCNPNPLSVAARQEQQRSAGAAAVQMLVVWQARANSWRVRAWQPPECIEALCAQSPGPLAIETTYNASCANAEVRVLLGTAIAEARISADVVLNSHAQTLNSEAASKLQPTHNGECEA